MAEGVSALQRFCSLQHAIHSAKFLSEVDGAECQLRRGEAGEGFCEAQPLRDALRLPAKIRSAMKTNDIRCHVVQPCCLPLLVSWPCCVLCPS